MSGCVSVDTMNENRDKEIAKIGAFSCKVCKLYNGQECFQSLDEDFVFDLRLSVASLTEYEKDLILLRKRNCHFQNSKLTSKENPTGTSTSKDGTLSEWLKNLL